MATEIGHSPVAVTVQKDALLERGERLDTYAEGQGIGMAVVADLVAIYEGRLDIADSTLGGAAVTLSFPV